MVGLFVTRSEEYMRALHGRYCPSCELPAVCSLGRQDVGEEHLRQLPEVEELISAAAQGHVEVGAVFLQSSLLKVLCELYYREEQAGELAFLWWT